MARARVNAEWTDAPDALPLLRMSFEQAAQAIFAGASPDSIVGLESVRKGRARPKPYLHWYAPIPVARLHQLEEVADSIEGPRYWFLQTFSPACVSRREGRVLEWCGFPIHFSPTTNALRELCAIVVDLDVGREQPKRRGEELTADEAIARVRQLVGDGSLPCPSLLAESGRGIYLVYLLSDSRQGSRKPVLNGKDTQEKWRRVARAFRLVTTDLAFDELSTAPAHPFKAPGRGAEPARYYAVARDSTEVRYWTLDEIATALPPAEERLAKSSPPAVGPRRRPSGKFDPARPERRRLHELELLAVHRGGIARGHRHRFLLCYTTDLRRLLRKEGERWVIAIHRAIGAARELNRKFCEPLDDYDVRSICRADSSVAKRQRNETVARLLDVTEAEVLALGLRSIIPARLAAQRDAKKHAHRSNRAARRAKVDELIRAGATIAEIIAATRYSKSSICARRKALGIVPAIT